MPATQRKTCRRCQTAKPTTAFSRKSGTRDGLARWCRACFAACYRQRAARRSTLDPATRMPDTKQCGMCRKTLPAAEFNRRTASGDGLQWHCRSCSAAASRARQEARSL